MRYCQWFSHLEEGEQEQWGSEALELAKISRTGVIILPGFVVSTQFYADFFTSPALKNQIRAACQGLTPNNPHHFAGVAQDIRQIVVKAAFSSEMKQSLANHFEQLHQWVLHPAKKGMRLVLSANLSEEVVLSEVLNTTSDLERALKTLYSLLFTEQELFERLRQKQPIVPVPFAVLVQYEEAPEYSGIAFCHDSSKHDDTTIQIQACHSLRPKEGTLDIEDTYRLDKKSLQLLSRNLVKQWWAEEANGKFVSPLHLGKNLQTLTDTQITHLARQVRAAEAPFHRLRQLEWVYMQKRFWISRVSLLNSCACQVVPTPARSAPLPLLVGHSGGLGVASGPIRLIKTKKDQAKMRDGEIVVIEKLSKQDIQWMAGAQAFISESGTHSTAEAAVAKQMGIPAVLALGSALSTLKDGQIITVDGTQGVVYAGSQLLSTQGKPDRKQAVPVTGTKVLATVLDPQYVNSAQLALSDGIGLLRGEFILRLLGVHPQDIIRRKLEKEYSEVLAEGLEKALRAVYPRPVIYQLHDIASIDLFGFGSKQANRHEPNPALGYRGAHRLLAEPEVLDLELKALQQLAKQGLTNFSVMLPMARSLQEVEAMLNYLRKSGLNKDHQVELWVKCETPALLILMEDLCKLDIAGVCFNVPTLTQFITGIDKENYQMAHHLDPTEPAVEQALRYAIATCRAQGVSTVIAAEMEDLRPEVIQVAVEAGVTGVSVAPVMLNEMHHLLSVIEKRLHRAHLLKEVKSR